MSVFQNIGWKVEQRTIFTVVFVAFLVVRASEVAFEWRTKRFLGYILWEHFLGVDFDCLRHDGCRCFAGGCAVVR